ncbi:MAG: hypothetical protein JWQ81_4500 [Amycolatopsis sp.]|jgi:hypothetical protein|uniref:hypothetical protein n=1 Tax=Amycolatopsis sp. TaxID=37632 RepID=UPI00260F8CF2|nr:hypothetical protein [Amycolatopsis sp.]MCU1683761.1 hypothetical protein [Amycolatopsis sp.]
MTSENTVLETLAIALCAVIDEIAETFGGGADQTVNGELDCAPARPGHLLCRQYGVRIESSPGAERRLAAAVIPMLERAGWRPTDRSTGGEVITQFSRAGANINVHVARLGDGVTIVGSTPCITAPQRRP